MATSTSILNVGPDAAKMTRSMTVLRRPDDQRRLDGQLHAPESAGPRTHEEHERHACDDAAGWRGDPDMGVVVCLLVSRIDDVAVDNHVEDRDGDVGRHDTKGSRRAARAGQESRGEGQPCE